MRTTIGAVVVAAVMATGAAACGVASPDPEPMPADVGERDRARADDLTQAPEALETVETGATSASEPAPEAPTAPTAPAAPAPAPAPDKITVSIDGVAMTLDGYALWAPNPVDPEEYDLFVKFHGTGAALGTDISLSALRTGAGCKSGENFLTYRPKGDAQYMPAGALGGKSDPACGLTIASLPRAVGDRFAGTFAGTLTSINVSPAKTRKVKLTFDVARAK